MKTLTRMIVALLVCAIAGLSTVGCNTFRGMGRDIQKSGEAVERSGEAVEDAATE